MGCGCRANHQLKKKEFHMSSHWEHGGDAHSLSIDVKGFKKEELSVHIDAAGRVCVCGKKGECCGFREVFEVPEDSNMDKISATYSSGLLTIKIPKKIVPKFGDSKEEDRANHAKEVMNTNEQEEEEEHEVLEEMISDEKKEIGSADQPIEQKQQQHVQQDQDQGQDREQPQIETYRQVPQEQQPPQPQMASNGPDRGDEHATYLQEEDGEKESTNGGREEVEIKQEHDDEKIGSEGVLVLERGKRRWLEGKVGWEEWRREDLDVKVKSAMEKIRKNKAMVFTAAVAFSLGFFLCHRLASRSPTYASSTSSGRGAGGEGSCKVDITIIERYLSNPHPDANESKNVGLIRTLSLL